MKIFSNDDIRHIERFTIEEEGIPSRDLINRVAEGVTAEILSRYRTPRPITIFAGPGNNGADALAVALMLIEQGLDPEIYLFNIHGNSLSRDCKYFRDKLMAIDGCRLYEIVKSMNPVNLTQDHIVVDGLFGSGLRDNLQGGFKTLVADVINESGADIISIDIPSGLFADWNPTTVSRYVVHATMTCAIQFPRLSFFFADNAEMIGEVKVIDIGLDNSLAKETTTKHFLVEAKDIKNLIKPRKEFCNKGDFGNGVLVAGSYGMAGAACLAAMGALRSGLGRLTVHGPQCINLVLQTAVPEACFNHDNNKTVVSSIPVATDNKHVYAVGPGLGLQDDTAVALETFVKQSRSPLVIDADGLNAIVKKPNILKLLSPNTILTPHAAEFDRLFGPQRSCEARLLKAIEVAREYNIIIVLKGHFSATVLPNGRVYFNPTGNPAMATPGSGDVLTGVILAMLGRGLQPADAAIAGVYLHGLAGDIVARKLGVDGVLASDIAKSLPLAIKAALQ